MGAQDGAAWSLEDVGGQKMVACPGRPLDTPVGPAPGGPGPVTKFMHTSPSFCQALGGGLKGCDDPREHFTVQGIIISLSHGSSPQTGGVGGDSVLFTDRETEAESG